MKVFYDGKGNTAVFSGKLFGDRPFHGEGHISKAGNTVHLVLRGNGVKPSPIKPGELEKIAKGLMTKAGPPKGDGRMTIQSNWYTKPDALAATDVFYGENPGDGGGY